MCYTYQGSELKLFAKAARWKAYWGEIISPYLGARVLDVGAGIGSTVRLLCGPRQRLWIALEPDGHLADEIRAAREEHAIPEACEVRVGTLQDLDAAEIFDTILYIDVLEHIADDRAEVQRAAAHLAPGGHLVVLAPAHQSLFTPFDQAVGHFRRYDRQALLALTPQELKHERVGYLDSVGLLASLGNRLVLKAAMPTAAQIGLWDRWIVPVSRLVDPVIGYRAGKSVLAIWVKV
jgi:SAM-dependent methyltransferase